MSKPKKNPSKGKSKGNFKGKFLQDKSDRLAPNANPVQWEAPKWSTSNKDFFGVRWTECKFYRGCLDYAYGLHWEGWSCYWCIHNPFGKYGEGRKLKGI